MHFSYARPYSLLLMVAAVLAACCCGTGEAGPALAGAFEGADGKGEGSAEAGAGLPNRASSTGRTTKPCKAPIITIKKKILRGSERPREKRRGSA